MPGKGHDFLQMLAWYIRQHKPLSLAASPFERSLIACAEYDSLQTEPMFINLLGRVES